MNILKTAFFLLLSSFAFGATAATPTSTPSSGNYSGVLSVAISSTSSGAVICWSTSDSPPPATNGAHGCNQGALYSGPLTVVNDEIIYAVAGGTGYTDSPVAELYFTVVLGIEPTLPESWVDNNEMYDGTYPISPYEYNMATQQWVFGPPPVCTFNWPYWTAGSPTTAGLQSAVNDSESCKSSLNPSCVTFDLPTVPNNGTFAFGTGFPYGLVIPQTSSGPTPCINIIQTTDDSLIPDGTLIGSGGMQDDFPDAQDPGVSNPDLTGNNMSIQVDRVNNLGPFTTTPTAITTATATMSGSVATFSYPAGFPSSFTVGTMLRVNKFTPAGYNSYWQILSVIGGGASITAQSCLLGPSSCISGLGPSTTSGTMNTEGVISGVTTISKLTTALTSVPATGINQVILADGYVSPGKSVEFCISSLGDTGCTNETVTTLSGPNQTGLIANFANTHVAGEHVVFPCVISSGCTYTFANGKTINSSNYNFTKHMAEITMTSGEGTFCGVGNTCSLLTLCNASGLGNNPSCATNQGPQGWLIKDVILKMPVSVADMDFLESMNGTPTSVSQLAAHMHFRKFAGLGDWTSPFSGSNAISSMFHVVGNYMSLGDCFAAQILRPGSEGHIFTTGYGRLTKLYHCWLEGSAIDSIIGGFGATASPPPSVGAGIGTDMEFRRSRFTFPWPWMNLSPILPKTNPNWLTSQSFVRKNPLEIKQGNRVARDGNIQENIDSSGGQGGPTGDLNTHNSSGGANGSNYTTVIANIYNADAIERNGCEGFELTSHAVAGSAAQADGAGLGGGNIWLYNILKYNVTTLNPGCSGVGGEGDDITTYVGYWTGTVTRDSSGMISTFTATCAVYGATTICPPPTGTGNGGGMTQTDIVPGDAAFITHCTDSSFNTPIGTVQGVTNQVTNNVTATMSAGVATFTSTATFSSQFSVGANIQGSGFAPSSWNTFWTILSGGTGTNSLTAHCVSNCSGLSNSTTNGSLTGSIWPVLGSFALVGTNGGSPNGLTVVYGNAGAPNAADSSGTCEIGYAAGFPFGVQYQHITFVTNSTHAISGTLGKSLTFPAQGGNFARYPLFRNSIVTGPIYNNDLGEGTPTLCFNFDCNGSLTIDHMVLVGRTSTLYTEFGNNPFWPDPSGCTGKGCSALSACTGVSCSMYFPTAATMCGYWSTLYSNTCTGGTQNLQVADYHAFMQQPWIPITSSGSPYAAGGPNDASDHTDMGANILAIDAAQVSNIFKCPWTCGSPGPFPDTILRVSGTLWNGKNKIKNTEIH